VAAGLRLHEVTVRAVAERFAAAGALLHPVTATCYLYPDFEPLRDRLRRTHGIEGGAALADLFARRHGIALLPGSAFGEPAECLRLRVATGRLYGETDAERTAALSSEDPIGLPWIRNALDHIERALAETTR
jgi:aspartate aminotransferase